MLALLAALTVHAQPILSVGEPSDMGIACSCHWARVFSRDDGLVDLFLTGGGNYTHVLLQRLADGTWQAMGAAQPLTSIGELIDHAITPCPDGTWLHVASANHTELLDDSFYMMHYGTELELLTQRLVVDGDTVLRYNDAPLVCDTRTVATVGHPRDLTSHDGVLMWLAPDGTVPEERFFDTIPPVGGSSLIWDPARERYLSFRALGPDSDLFITFLDRDFQADGAAKIVQLDPRPPYLAWPQSVIRLGDGYAVAHLIRRDGVPYASDQGDIQITVLDSALDLVQSVRVTEVEPGGGAHRPSLARVGDELLVTYEEQVQPRLVVLQLDPDLPPEPDPETGVPGWLESETTDTGVPTDSGTPADTGGTSDSGAPSDTPDPDGAPAQRPVADAGPDRTVAVGTAVQLDGRSSTDPDSIELAFLWTFDDPTVSLVSPDQSVAIFEPTVPGTYRFQLVVTADGAASTDDVVVTVQEAKGCGCASASGMPAAWLGLLAFIGLWRRSSRSPLHEAP